MSRYENNAKINRKKRILIEENDPPSIDMRAQQYSKFTSKMDSGQPSFFNNFGTLDRKLFFCSPTGLPTAYSNSRYKRKGFLNQSAIVQPKYSPSRNL